MKTKQTIAIIGATGNMGSAIASKLSRHDYRLVLMGRNQKKLTSLRRRLSGADAPAQVVIDDCAKDACWEADTIILACPYPAEHEVAERIRDVATGKIVVSISNPLNSKHNALVTAADTSAAEQLQELLPYSKVVKAFNTTFPSDFATPVIDGQRTDSFIASNDHQASETVSEIVATAGFNPVVVGNLSWSRTLEHMQLMLIQVAMRNNYSWHAGWKILHA